MSREFLANIDKYISLMYNTFLHSHIFIRIPGQTAVTTNQAEAKMIELPNGFAQAGALIQAGFLVWFKAHLKGKTAVNYFELSPHDQEVYYYRYKKEMRLAMEQLREQMTIATQESCVALIFFNSLSVRVKNALVRANTEKGTEDFTNPLWLVRQSDSQLDGVQNLGRKGIQEIRAKLEENGIRAY